MYSACCCPGKLQIVLCPRVSETMGWGVEHHHPRPLAGCDLALDVCVSFFLTPGTVTRNGPVRAECKWFHLE